mgnify:FL=1
MNRDTEIADRLQLAIDAGTEAGKSTLEHFCKGVSVERKADNSPVTIADQNAERLLRKRIAEAFHNDSILEEEFGEYEGDSGFR